MYVTLQCHYIQQPTELHVHLRHSAACHGIMHMACVFCKLWLTMMQYCCLVYMAIPSAKALFSGCPSTVFLSIHLDRCYHDIYERLEQLLQN